MSRAKEILTVVEEVGVVVVFLTSLSVHNPETLIYYTYRRSRSAGSSGGRQGWMLAG